MGNRVARLATPCFSPGGGGGARGHRGEGAAADAYYNGDAGDGHGVVGHILSFDGRDGPAKGIGAIHGILLPSNQSTVGSAGGGGGGGSVLTDSMSFSGSSSFDSSTSFSFRQLQPGPYSSGPLEYSTSSPSTSTSGRSASRHGQQRTDEQILADLYATRHRRRHQCRASGSPLLGGLRRAVSSVLRASPCVSPGRMPMNHHQDGEPVAAVGGGDGAGIVGSGAIKGGGAGEDVNGGAAARVQWARGKAGEDRVHVVVSEEHGWMFVGIYDGFNGPDATDYLVEHLYASVCRELNAGVMAATAAAAEDDDRRRRPDDDQEVLDALARALQATEAGYFAEAEARAAECPELAMMGSCVLVVLIKGADVYVMNVGDSRAVLAQQAEPDLSRVLVPRQDDDAAAGVRTEEIKRRFDECDMGDLGALQLTMDHSTSVYKEVRRIQSEHLDDPACIVETFTASYPGEDPAKFLSHEILRRAAKQAGMEVHELLEVQQGDRRRYHDDVSIIIISLEGKIWTS
ncbi:hypothetical protein EJB05_50012, partial [Eragrostis curvula]